MHTILCMINKILDPNTRKWKRTWDKERSLLLVFVLLFTLILKTMLEIWVREKKMFIAISSKREMIQGIVSCNRIITSGVGVLKLKLSGNALKSTGEQVLELCIVWTLRNNGWLILEAPWPVLLLRSSVLLWISAPF